jgi:hypothetical protein
MEDYFCPLYAIPSSHKPGLLPGYTVRFNYSNSRSSEVHRVRQGVGYRVWGEQGSGGSVEC